MPEVWGQDFNNEKRHCWYLKDGTRYLNGSFEKPCKAYHADPKVVGEVEWLRFIHEWLAFGKEFVPSDDGGRLFLNSAGTYTTDGRYAYCEEYYDKDDVLTFRVFLQNDEGWARIECYKPELIEQCNAAYEKVQWSYIAEAVK